MKLLLILPLLLSGCVTTAAIEHKQAHPNWPDPIMNYDAKWQVKTQGDKTYIGMEARDFETYRIWNSDVLRYVRDMKTMACYYRPDDVKCEINLKIDVQSK